MADTMDKQGLLDELRRRNGTSQQGQSSLMDKQQILDYLRQRSSAQQQGPGTFAPVKQEKTAKDYVSHLKAPEQEPQKWYQGYLQKGAFEDGYQVGDATKTILGTQQDVRENAAAGVASAGEKIIDFLAFIAPYFAAGSQWNETAISAPTAHVQAQKQQLEYAKQAASDFIEKDIINEQKVGETFGKHSGGIIPQIVLRNEKTDDVSILGEKSDAIVQSLSQMAATAAATAATGGALPWWAVTGATSFGGEAENAIRQGATMEQAGLSAAVSAGAEILTEKLFGGSGLGEKGLINLEPLTKGITNKVVKTLFDYGIDVLAEGGEEVLSTVMSNLATSLYREENPAELIANGEAFEGWVDSLISGMLVGGMMNVGKVGTSISNKTDYRNYLTAAEQKVFDKQYDDALKQAEKEGKVTNEQRRELYDATLDAVKAQRPATPTQSGETAQAEKVTTKTETPTQTAQTAQTPSQPMTPQQAMQETIAEIIGVPSVTQAVESFRQNGKVSNSQAEAIIADEGVFREILEMTGIAPPTTKSESRAAVKQAVAKLAQETVSDNAKIASESTGADATIAETVAPTNTKTETATKSTIPEYSVGAAMPHETKRSRVIENTYANATDPEMRAAGEAALKEDPDIGNYSVIPESESLFEAEQRTRDEADMQREYDYLMEKRGGWTSADNDTAMKLRDYFYQKEDPRFADIVQRQAEEGTQAGQFIQSFAKYTRMTGEDAAAEVVTEMEKLKESDLPKRFYKDGGFEQWKGDVITSSMNIAKQIDSVEDGDVDGMKDIIRSMAKWRKTTAWFGLSSNLSKAAEAAMKDIDFETAKAIANAQLSTLPGDFKKRPVGQVVKTIRIHNMLSALTTINRNLVGNTAVGFIDATSDSTSGRLIDALVSKVTGKRTVGNDIKYGKTYMDAAWKATKMASLCAELDIPMDSESRFTTGTTRTYSPQGNPIMRFMSAYEKYMKYALEVTDQFYQGGANAAVDASLQEISGNGTLTQEEAEAIAKLAGQRRTLKDERAATRMAKKLRQGLNEAGTENIGLGDLTMPFATIGSTSAHVAIDYTAGSVTGLAQVFQLMSDVKKGRYVDGVKTIYKNGKPVRTVTLAEAQRAAVTNAGRGITGLGLVTVFAGLAAAGILKAHDDKDKDKRGLEQAQNLSGAQLNIDAALRGLQGKSTDWQNDDLVISVDFLEPFNAQMYLGYLLSQDESVLDAVKSYPKHAIRSVVSSIADMPPMQGMQEALDILSGLQDVGDEEGGLAQWAADSAGQVIGSTASGFIPGWLRQTAQVIDPYYRDTSGDTATDAAINQVKAAIPGLSQTLPKKYSGLGQEQLRDDDWISGIFNTMVNPGDADRIKTTEVTEFLDELYDLTGDLGIYPDAAAPKSFTQDKKTYTISTKEETEIYQKTYGSEVNKLYSEIIKSADFQNLDGADQAAVLEKAKEAARALAKSKISGKYTPPSSIKNKPIYKSDAQAILDAYLEAKRKAEKEAQKEAFKESYWANKNGQ